jgi:hypothetical protein
LPTLIEMAEAVRQAAGWSRPLRPSGETVEFELENDLRFELVRRSGRLAAFTADLGAWPDDEGEADELARRLARLAAGAFSRRRAVVSVAGGRYGLHSTFDPEKAGAEGTPRLCSAFLNDLDWWRGALGG